MNSQENSIPVILGPTSSGKTSLALHLCQKYNGEIISADSRQIYKEMDIGTGKKPVRGEYEIKKGDGFWEINGINIWGYDLVLPDQYFSAYDFAQFAHTKMREILSSGKKPFLVGGTGFYIDMVTGRVKPSQVKPDPELREELEELSLEDLQQKLKNLSSKEFQKIDENNPTRIIRAIEKLTATEKRDEPLNYLPEIEFFHLELTAKREILYQRADSWLEEIWQAGLLAETKKLRQKYPNSKKLQGLVYRSATSYLEDELSKEEAKQRAKYDLHAYIRRQQTYFKKMPVKKQLDITQDNLKQIVYNIVDG